MVRALAALAACGGTLLAGGCTRAVPQTSRPVIAVAPVVVNRPAVSSELGPRFRGALIDNLIRCEQFIVIDDPLGTWRPANAAAMSSAELINAARRASGSPLQPAHLVEVEVVEYANAPADRRPGSSGDPEAHVGLELQISNLDSGQPVAREPITIRERLRDHEGLRDTAPLNRAANRAVRAAVTATMRALPPTPWTPMVERVEGNGLILNGGADRQIQVGDRYQLFRIADPYYDVNTGRLGGFQLSESMGILEVREVRPTSALLTFPEGWQVEVGMVLRPVEVRARHWWERVFGW